MDPGPVIDTTKSVAFAMDDNNSQCLISFSYTQTMTRTEKTKMLIKERFGGNQAEFARAIKRSPNLVWQYLNDHRTMGEKFARHVEKSLRLPSGWLDDPNDTGLVSIARRELTAEEKADAQRLKALWDERFSGQMSQMEIAHRCGWSTQGAFNQYLNGKIPLNLSALIKISAALEVDPGEISPRLRREIDPGKGKPTQDELTPLQPIEAWDSNSPLDPDEVEVPLFREVELAAGNGHAHQIEYNGAKLKFAKSSLRRAGVPEEAAACAFVSGDSMEPMLPDGSTVGVDTSAKNIVDGKLYAIDHNGELRVKQVFRIPGGRGLRFHSFNADKNNFPDEELSPERLQEENVRIIGRVFWSAAFW